MDFSCKAITCLVSGLKTRTWEGGGRWPCDFLSFVSMVSEPLATAKEIAGSMGFRGGGKEFIDANIDARRRGLRTLGDLEHLRRSISRVRVSKQNW
jgi:hypothetical protein